MQSLANSSSASQFRLVPMAEEVAREIAQWRYEGEYALYNSDAGQTDESYQTYLNPDYAYHAVWHEDIGLCGFCCFGIDAQVPGGDYTEEAVDIGLGLRPDLVGQGLGRSFLRAILHHAPGGASDIVFRATIAAFNGRSRRLFEQECFAQEQEFTAPKRALESEPLEFVIMVRRPLDQSNSP